MRTATRPLLAALVLGLSACNASPTATAPASSPAVATVNGKAISVAELQAKMAEQPPLVRARYQTLERRRELLDTMIRFELLLQEARRAGLEKDPEVQASLEKILVQRVIRLRQEQAEEAETPEAELRKHYEQNLSEYVRPARLRLSHVFLASPRGDSGRPKVREEAERLLSEVKRRSAGANGNALAPLAGTRSDDSSSKTAGGELGFKTHEDLAEAWGKPFAAAADGLKAIGEIGGVVETERGFHLIQLLGRQAGMDQSFESVKARIQSRLALEKRARALEDYLAELRAKASLTVDEEALGRLGSEGPAPATKR